MKDGIASRVARLISGSAHSLIDAVENVAPEATMRQAIREVDAAADEIKLSVGKVLAAKHMASMQITELNGRHEELGAQIETALAHGEEALAKAGIAGQLDIEAQLPVLQKSLQENAEEEAELCSYIEALQARKREMEAVLDTYLAAQQVASAGGAAPSGAPTAKAERASDAFNRVVSAQTGVSSAAAIAAGEQAAKLKQLAELARNHKIEERMAMLKAQQSTSRDDS